MIILEYVTLFYKDGQKYMRVETKRLNYDSERM